jgi:hypothetical protein
MKKEKKGKEKRDKFDFWTDDLENNTMRVIFIVLITGKLETS